MRRAMLQVFLLQGLKDEILFSPNLEAFTFNEGSCWTRVYYEYTNWIEQKS